MAQYFDDHPFDIVKLLDNGDNLALKHLYFSKVDAVFKLLDLSEGSRILDVGCGTGYATLKYDKFYNRKINVVGVDISDSSIKLAKEHALKLNRKYQFLTANATSLPFDDNSFNAAFCINLLHHIDDHVDALKEMARVAEKVCCVEPNDLNPLQRKYQKTEVAKMAGDTKAFNMANLVKDFKSVGLKNIKTMKIHFFHPNASGFMLKMMIHLEPILLKTPLISLMSGGLVVYGER